MPAELPDVADGKHYPRWKIKYGMGRAFLYRPGKHDAETRLIDRVFDGIPPCTVLDIPCGNGRFSTYLAEKGYRVTAADYSESMLELTRNAASAKGLSFSVVRDDVESLGLFPDRQFETVLCFRLFHHFPEAEIRQRVVSQLCSVAKEYVALSYFSPNSVSSIKQYLEYRYCGKTPKKYPTSLFEINAYFKAHGFGLVRDFPLMNLIHTLHVALYRRM